MEKPLISLSTKEFLSGIAMMGAHAERGGIFYKADGVTPLFEAGSAISVNNGFLMAGASATTIGGTPNGNFICSKEYDFGTAPYAFFGTSTGHIFRQELTATGNPPSGANLSDLRTVGGTAIYALEGMQPVGGTNKLYYFMNTAIGDYDGSTFDDTATFSTGGSTISQDYIRATHRYFDKILYGNGYGNIGMLSDDGSAGMKNTLSALDIPGKSIATAISDDGTYAVTAFTNNIACDPGAYSDTRVIFWDGFSSSWLREYPIPDPFILSIKKTPIGVFAFGITGIWQVTFSGVKKVFSIPTGIYTTFGYNTLLYGKATSSFFSDSVIWGGSSGSNYVIKSFGKLDTSAPLSYLSPFLSTASKNITLVDGQILKGWLYVADDTPQLKAYPFSTANSPQTSISAQTVYFQLPTKMEITRVDIVFGEPLVSGDSMSIQFKTDEDASVTPTTALSATYAADGAIRRKSVKPVNLFVEDQLSLVINFTAGAVKIKKIDIFGTVAPIRI